MTQAISQASPDKRAKIWDRMAEKYSRQPIKDQAAYEKKLEITQSYLNPEMAMLEFGCGTGGTAIAHAPYVKNVHAVDISSSMIDIAKRKAAEADVANISFEVSAFDAFDPSPGSYDVVLGMSILHLLEDPQAAVQSVHRWLKPGGYFVSSTACIGDFAPYFVLIGGFMRLIGQWPYVNILKQASLIQTLEDAGFSIEHEWLPKKGASVFIVAKKV